ncbi:PhzF family phenazine biosynthesis protein [Dactylosporangium sp. CA-139066]|uniref:PhzF family phenazine biosynthesis protein n=1 Tax=Dactylosporangium sp. CA-139066 TaxID=3239930 RepID=UPI003D90B289
MLDYVVADVFTDTALEGNPVAVFLDAEGLTAQRMQRIAREMNLSETTFVLPPSRGGDVRVRIFTPVNELPFAGHPTLGTAIALTERDRRPELNMETAMGMVPFRFDGGPPASSRARIARMLQPVPTWQPYARAGELLAALGLERSTLPVDIYRNGPRHVFVGLPDIEALSAVRPDLNALAGHEDLAVNCFAGGGTTWRSRMFSPAYGVAEDAATGSAAGPLALHLGRYGATKFGATVTIRQGVEMGRPSTMYARVDGGPDDIERIEVAGAAVVVARGTLEI